MAERGKLMGVRVDPELYRRLKVRALTEGKTATLAVAEAFAAWPARPQPEPRSKRTRGERQAGKLSRSTPR